MLTIDALNERTRGTLPGLLGIVITEVSTGMLAAELTITPAHMAPNGFLHAGTLVTLADTSAGCGCWASLPPEASGFTTV